MHMVSRKDFNSAKLETVRVSKSPMKVVTANGEVQTREEATICIKELDLFVTVMLLEETPAVLALGKLCEDHRKTYHWTSSQKRHLTKNGRKVDCNTANYVPFLVPGLSTSSSSSSSRTSPGLSTSSSTSSSLTSPTSSSQDGQGNGSPKHVLNRRRQTHEGPEPACVQTPFIGSGTRSVRRAN